MSQESDVPSKLAEALSSVLMEAIGEWAEKNAEENTEACLQAVHAALSFRLGYADGLAAIGGADQSLRNRQRDLFFRLGKKEARRAHEASCKDCGGVAVLDAELNVS